MMNQPYVRTTTLARSGDSERAISTPFHRLLVRVRKYANGNARTTTRTPTLIEMKNVRASAATYVGRPKKNAGGGRGGVRGPPKKKRVLWGGNFWGKILPFGWGKTGGKQGRGGGEKK